MRHETRYQRDLIKRIEARFHGSRVLKNDPTRIQGIPDLLVLWGPNWAMLETKIRDSADIQPNQEFYISLFNEMSFASFIWPEIEEEVLDALQVAFGAAG